MYLLLEMVVFHCYISLPEGKYTIHGSFGLGQIKEFKPFYVRWWRWATHQRLPEKKSARKFDVMPTLQDAKGLVIPGRHEICFWGATTGGYPLIHLYLPQASILN